MTIAAGFVCHDGIVLCADSQEVIPGYTKNETEKIREWKDQGLCIATAGAGETHLIEGLSDRIEKALVEDYSPEEARFPRDCQSIIEQVQREFFDAAIAPYSSFPCDDRPSMPELLIMLAVSSSANAYESLFVASGTTVRELQPGAECIGSGVMVAKSLIERFYSPFDSLDALILAASYVMYHTKRWTDGCGGDTSLMVSSVKNQFFGGIFNVAEISVLEGVFKDFDEHTKNLLLNLVNTNFNHPAFRRQTRYLQDRLIEIQNQPSVKKIVESLQRFKPKRVLATKQRSMRPAQS